MFLEVTETVPKCLLGQDKIMMMMIRAPGPVPTNPVMISKQKQPATGLVNEFIRMRDTTSEAALARADSGENRLALTSFSVAGRSNKNERGLSTKIVHNCS